MEHLFLFFNFDPILTKKLFMLLAILFLPVIILPSILKKSGMLVFLPFLHNNWLIVDLLCFMSPLHFCKLEK